MISMTWLEELEIVGIGWSPLEVPLQPLFCTFSREINLCLTRNQMVIDDTRTGKTRYTFCRACQGEQEKLGLKPGKCPEVVLYHDQNVSVFITAAYQTLQCRLRRVFYNNFYGTLPCWRNQRYLKFPSWLDSDSSKLELSVVVSRPLRMFGAALATLTSARIIMKFILPAIWNEFVGYNIETILRL